MEWKNRPEAVHSFVGENGWDSLGDYRKTRATFFSENHNNPQDCWFIWVSLSWVGSGSRESNPGHMVPNHIHYHYATPRPKSGRETKQRHSNKPQTIYTTIMLHPGWGGRHKSLLLYLVSESGVKALLTTRWREIFHHYILCSTQNHSIQL